MLRLLQLRNQYQRVMLPAAVMLLSVLTVGCTSKDLYNAVQENRLQACSELYGAQREECEAQYQKDYETYKRDREEVLAAKPKIREP